MQHEERKVVPYLNHDLLSFFECLVCVFACMYRWPHLKLVSNSRTNNADHINFYHPFRKFCLLSLCIQIVFTIQFQWISLIHFDDEQKSAQFSIYFQILTLLTILQW